jgi:hypothetical protein
MSADALTIELLVLVVVLVTVQCVGVRVGALVAGLFRFFSFIFYLFFF